MDYLSEAFKQLEILNEDVFDLDKDGLEDLKDFQDETEEEVIDVIDPEAENEEELEDSYIGKVILDCSVCHTDIYKDKEDVIIDEETQLANVGEECPYCFSVDGFKVIGEVKPFVETEFETEDDVEVEVDGEEVEEEEDEEEKNESLRKRDKKSMDESLRRKSLKESQATDYESMMLIGQFKDLHKKVRHIEKLINSRFSIKNDDDINAVYDILYEEFEKIRSSKDWSPYYFDSDGGEISMITDGREKPQSYVLLSLESGVSFSFYFDMTGYDDDVNLSDYLEKYPQMSKFFDTALFKFFPRFIAALMRRFSSASRNESISRRNRKSLTEAPVYGLEPRYDSRKSFYGKAQVDTGDNGDKNKLYSYGTLVAEMKDGKPVVYGTYSQTTLRHIKDWLKQNGFKAETSRQILADYGVKDESCGRKSVKESKVPMKMSKKPLKEGWRGTPVKIVSHGSWGDPDLVWNGYTFNYWDIEDAMWSMFLEETGHKDSESNDPAVEEEFNKYVQDNYEDYLGDVIFGGYFDEGSKSWHDRYKRESLKNRKSRKLKESIGSDLKKFLDFYEDRLNQQENADVIEKIDAILDDNDLSGDTDIDKLFYAMNFSDREKIMSLIDGAKKVSPWRDLRKMKESIEDIKIDTGDQEISVSAKDKEDVESDDEMIAPLSDETKTDIEMNTEEEENGDEVDVDMDEFSEEEFDDLGESYLKKVYENVNKYKTTSVKEKDNKLVIEGLIKFTSGKTKKTSFVFEAKTIDKNGHAKFLGENLQISRGHKSFKLSGTVSNNKFIAESLNYNYRAKNGKNSQRVYGTVKVNKK